MPENTNEQGTQVTSADLLKSLHEIEGKTEEDKPKVAKPPTVKVEELTKTMQDRIAAEGSENLKKALDVSGPLSEIVSLLGVHVDESLETLEKNAKDAAQRDLAVVSALGELKKSIDANTEELKKLGQAPQKPQITTEVLKKGLEVDKATEQDDPAQKGTRVRRQILAGLESLTKSAVSGSADQQRFIQAAATFEATGKIGDRELAEANGEYRRLSGTKK